MSRSVELETNVAGDVTRRRDVESMKAFTLVEKVVYIVIVGTNAGVTRLCE
jgi:predicted RNase H-related nuclease YkuK (DUF458 family)